MEGVGRGKGYFDRGDYALDSSLWHFVNRRAKSTLSDSYTEDLSFFPSRLLVYTAHVFTLMRWLSKLMFTYLFTVAKTAACYFGPPSLFPRVSVFRTFPP